MELTKIATYDHVLVYDLTENPYPQPVKPYEAFEIKSWAEDSKVQSWYKGCVTVKRVRVEWDGSETVIEGERIATVLERQYLFGLGVERFEY